MKNEPGLTQHFVSFSDFRFLTMVLVSLNSILFDVLLVMPFENLVRLLKLQIGPSSKISN